MKILTALLVATLSLPSLATAQYQPAFLPPEFSVLHHFPRGITRATGALVEGDDGHLYGLDPGAGRGGIFYRYSTDGVVTPLHDFLLSFGYDGLREGFLNNDTPSPLSKGLDGNFYTTVSLGFPYNQRTVIRISPAGLVTLISLPSGSHDAGPVVADADGTVHGIVTPNHPTYPLGGVFHISPAGVFSVTPFVMPLGHNDGLHTYGLWRLSDGQIYGTSGHDSELAGQNCAIFRYSAATGIALVAPVDWNIPNFHFLLRRANGNILLGTNEGGDNAGFYWFIEVNPAGDTVATYDAGAEYGRLVEGNDGKLYGTGQDFFSGSMGLFRIENAPTSGAATVTSLYSFAANGLFSNRPVFAGMSRNTAGDLFMVTGGSENEYGARSGLLKRAAATGAVAVAPFQTWNPISSVAVGLDGSIYGMGGLGKPLPDAGPVGATLFRRSPTGAVSTLGEAEIGSTSNPEELTADGSQPPVLFSTGEVFGTSLVHDSSYAVTPFVFGGAFENGPTVPTLYRRAVRALDGAVYGAVDNVIRRFSTTGASSVLVDTSSHPAVFNDPVSGLVRGADDALYAVCDNSDTYGDNVLIRIGTGGVISVVAQLGEIASHESPLTLGPDGAFYGISTNVSLGGYTHSVYRVTMDGAVTTNLVQFSLPTSLYAYRYRPAMAPNGKIYLTIGQQKAWWLTPVQYVNPTLYELNPATGTAAVIARLAPESDLLDTFNPMFPPTVGPDGNVYGSTYAGGDFGGGTLWKYTTGLTLPVVAATTAKPTQLGAIVSSVITPGTIPATWKIEYGITASLGSETALATVPAGNGPTLVTHNFTGLSGSQTVYYRFTATGGSTAQSPVLSFTTIDRPATVAEWNLQEFGNAPAPELGDNDGDGIANLTEYALVLPGATPGTLPPAQTVEDSGQDFLQLTVQRDPVRSDVTIQVQATSDLGGEWETIAESVNGGPFTGVAVVTGDGTTSGVKTVQIRDYQSTATSGRRYVRIRVVR